MPPESFSFCAMWRSEHRPPLWPHHTSCTVSCCSWGRPTGHMTRDFHCKEGRQEVEWKPGLSTVSLTTQPTARPSHCQQEQLGQALRWPIVQWGLHVFTAVGVSLGPAESVQRGNSSDQRRTSYFYHHIGPQFPRSSRQKYLSAVESQHECNVETADDEIVGLFTWRSIKEESVPSLTFQI